MWIIKRNTIMYMTNHQRKEKTMTDIYQITVQDQAGKTQTLEQYRGKVLLIVNTATECGFTPQYADLQELYDKYRNQGLEILDFPCNQFGHQAPGSAEEIAHFCSTHFGITFPQYGKIEVNGTNQAPLFAYLKAEQGFKGFDKTTHAGKFMDEMLSAQDKDYAKKSDIKWNFTKFLINRQGKVINRFEPTEEMSSIEPKIAAELK